FKGIKYMIKIKTVQYSRTWAVRPLLFKWRKQWTFMGACLVTASRLLTLSRRTSRPICKETLPGFAFLLQLVLIGGRSHSRICAVLFAY
ncbi:MAG: hypothetical protein ACKPKO_12975, partial [Candidatus Fonsibacter sp.]